MIRKSLNYPLRSKEAAKTILIGGFLLSLGTVLPLIFIAGYIVRILDQPLRKVDTPPVFDQWFALAADGTRALLIWITYSIIPLLILLVWIEMYAVATEQFTTPYSQNILNSAVHVYGTVVGGPMPSRDIKQTVQDTFVFIGLLPNPSLRIGTNYIVRSVGGLYILSLLASFYIIPAALKNFAKKRTVRAGFEFYTIKNLISHRKYLRAWIVAVSLWFVGALLPMLWNEWRVWARNESAIWGGVLDWELLQIGIIPIIAYPTDIGVLSTTFLLIVSFMNFYFLLAGYTLLSRTLAEVSTAG